MKAVEAFAGALIVDSLPFSLGGTEGNALSMKGEGVDGFVGYLGAINEARVQALLDAEIAFMPVTFGTTPIHYDGAASVASCKKLGLPEGCSVWLDMEGLSVFHTMASVLMAAANAWAQVVADAGYMACLYVGVPQPLTGDELYSLAHVRYWHGQGEVRDRHNAFANPACGWCMKQKWPSIVRGGVLVDDNTVSQDDQGRLPWWAVAA